MRTIIILLVLMVLPGCGRKDSVTEEPLGIPVADEVFTQDYSIKYYLRDDNQVLTRVVCDRNGYIQVLSSEGLLKPAGGQFLFPGTLEPDRHYRPVADKKIGGITVCDDQIVYISEKAVLSNAWAGKLYLDHNLPQASMAASGGGSLFLVSDGRNLELLCDSCIVWRGPAGNDMVKEIRYDEKSGNFLILGNITINIFDPRQKSIVKTLTDSTLTCFEVSDGRIIAGTTCGYLVIDPATGKVTDELNGKMPWCELSAVALIKDRLWFGSPRGAMMLRKDGRFNYYSSERWLPSDSVIHIAEGPGNSVLVLTDRGLAKIMFEDMTLAEKASFFERQVRERHIRNGFNATLSSIAGGNISTGSLEDSDNDGLWTSMYLASQAFRYAVTESDDALKNISESLDAMERLYTINPVPGFPARSFERRGYKYNDPPWRRADNPEWDWKSTTSSDEAIGHIFAFGVIAELVKEINIRKKAVMLIDTLMSHIVNNNLYLVDWDGKPTRWGRWNPEYVNAFPSMVGDRKLNSSNITGMLQTAYHFTGKEKYREKAFELMTRYGYLENLLRPMSEIGVAPEGSDSLSRLLSEEWNHSDDEMYFCGYWGLYNYAFNDTLKKKYEKAIADHWEAERAEKDGLWNIMTAITGNEDSGLNDALWFLREYPLDMITWTVSNSHRKDIQMLEPNFRNQTITEVLPPDELKISRHNANRFILDGGDGGRSEMSAGDIWLLPYWMGRYLGLIDEPEKSN